MNSASDEEDDVADEDLIYQVGTAVKIQKMLRFPDGSMRLLGQGIARCRIKKFLGDEPYMLAEVELIEEDVQDDSRTLAYMRGVANNFLKIIDASETLSEELKVVVMNIDDPGRLADLIATNLDIEVAEKQEILEEKSPRKRLQILSKIVMRELDVLELGQKLQTRVRKSIDKDQREYYLRQQLKAIQRELGDADEGSVELDELRERIDEADLPEKVQAAAEREFDRLARMSPGASEYTVSKTYLDWLLDLPWNVEQRGQAEPEAGRGDPRARPLRSGGRQGTHPRVPGRAQAEGQPPRAHPLPGRTAGRGQDLARAQHRRGHGAQVLPLLPGRHARRGRDPRPPPHLRRLHARPHHRRHQGVRHQQSRCSCSTRSTSWARTSAAIRPAPCSRCSTPSRTTTSPTTT